MGLKGRKLPVNSFANILTLFSQIPPSESVPLESTLARSIHVLAHLAALPNESFDLCKKGKPPGPEACFMPSHAGRLILMSIESRSRMISFRLTQDEYDKFRRVCFTHGIRSVSEMARAAINMLLQEPERAPNEAIESRVAELEARVQMLFMEVKRLDRSGMSLAVDFASKLPSLDTAQQK